MKIPKGLGNRKKYSEVHLKEKPDGKSDDILKKQEGGLTVPD